MTSAGASGPVELATSHMNAFSVSTSEPRQPSSQGSGLLPGSGDGAVVGLHTLAVNQPARVVDLVASDDGDDNLLLRLMEIGFLPGEMVRIVATGFPGPDPLAVRVGAATFALRRYEASRVLVVPEAKP